MKRSSVVAKGAVVDIPSPWMIVPLSASHVTPFNLEAFHLPRYHATTMTKRPAGLLQPLEKEKALRDFFDRVLDSRSMPVYFLVTTLRILVSEEDLGAPTLSKKSPSSRLETVWNNDEERDMACEGWALVQRHACWDHFVSLYLHIRKHMHLLSAPHPLVEYISKVFPLLDSSEQEVALQVLRRLVHKKHAHASTLGIMHAVVDACQQQPNMYAVLFESHDAPRPSSSIIHSCLPNVAWDVRVENGESKMVALALYELESGEDISVAMVDTTLSMTERTTALAERFGREKDSMCNCCRCKYERDACVPPNLRDLQRLGHFCFQEGRYLEAQHLYRAALDKDVNLPDIWHALGAMYLQQLQFYQAQRFWKDATEKYEFLKSHRGIALQLKKQISYRYWDKITKRTDTVQLPMYIEVSPGLCFATKEPILTSSDCKKVITWAEDASCGWTTSRHYAVPTTDVPVHEVPSLLNWFMDCMESKIYSLLSTQFSCPDSNQWYVHDAFVVRYDACQTNNHLPLHLDESTHSFVLSLNDGYQGGGTFFEGLDQTIDVSEGNIVTFRGDTLRHGGNVVTSGVRYILAVFLYLDARPRLSSESFSSQPQKRCKLKHVFPDKKEDEKTSFSFGFDLSTAT